MEKLNNKTALVTGSNSGIGFEAAFQLSQDGYDKIILAARTEAKAEDARRRLIKRGSSDIFDTVAFDTSEADSALRAGKELLNKGYQFDLLILNAGMSAGDNLQKNSKGLDLTFSSTLVGHHALTIDLLSRGGIRENASIVIAGSEAATDDLPMPGFSLPDIDEEAKNSFDGDLSKLLIAYAKAEHPEKYNSTEAYALAKLYVAWWAAELSRKVKNGIKVFAVSPGAVADTNFGRDMPFAMKYIMLPLMKSIGGIMGMNASVDKGARRYLDAAKYDHSESGKFFASKPGKMIGPLYEQRSPKINDVEKQKAAYQVITELTGNIDLVELVQV